MSSSYVNKPLVDLKMLESSNENVGSGTRLKPLGFRPPNFLHQRHHTTFYLEFFKVLTK